MFGSTAPAFGANTTAQTGTSPFGTGSSQTSNNAASGFGGFGAMNQNNNANGAAVGSTGGAGLFGMSNNNNNNNNIGSSSSNLTGTAGNSGPFGQATPATSNPPSLFGSSSAASNPVSNPQQGSGTAIKPFTPYTEKDATTGMNNIFQSISCMPEYRNFSFEELRLQDYQANRRFPSNSSNAAVGVASPFGANQTNSPFNNTNSSSSFGMVGNNSNTNSGGGLFGQNNGAAGPGATSSFGQPANSMFGGTAQNNAVNSPFGMNKPASAGGLFGQNNNAPGGNSGGLFGQNPSTQTQGGSGGLFGQNNTNAGGTGGGLFGASNAGQPSGGLFGNNTANTNTGGGLFGQANQTQNPSFGGTNNNTTGGGLFGQNNNNAANSPFGQTPQQAGGGLFGNKSGATGGLFGASNTTGGASNGLFGQNNASSTPFGQANSTGGGLFGQNQNQNPPNNAGGGLFGQSSNNTNAGGPFGQTNTTNTNTGSGLFGNNPPNNSGGLFGQNTASNSTFGQNTSGFSSFGQPQQQPQPQAQQSNSFFGNKPAGTTGGGLFGQSGNTASTGFGQGNPSGGLFGQNNTSNNSTGNSGGLFGQNNAGGGLFGQNPNQQQQPQQQQPQQQAGGLFGQNNTQPPQGGMFGQNSSSTGGGLFGQNSSQPPTGGGLFGSKPANNAAGSGGLFGQNNNQQQPSGGLFGQNSNANASNTGGLFGNKPTGSTGGSLFGQNNANAAAGTGGLFGQNNQNPSNSTGTGGLFGAKPADNGNSGGGLFGAKPSGTTGTTGGLFGSKPGMSSGSGGLFGSKPAGSGLNFNSGGSNNNNVGGTSSGLSGGLFGNQQNQQPSLQASQPAPQQGNINPYGTNELFSRVIVPNSITQPSKPSATKLNADLKKKASLSGAYRLAPKPLFAPRSSSSSPVAQLGLTAPTKSGGRISSMASSTDSLGREILPANTGSSSIFTNESDDLLLASNDVLFNPDKKSFKNLIINRKKMEDTTAKDDDQVLRITFAADEDKCRAEDAATPTASLDSGKNESFFEDIQRTPLHREVRPEGSFKSKVASTLSAENPTKTAGIAGASSTKIDGIERSLGVLGDDVSFNDDGYYMSPSLETLSSMTLLQLRKVSGLTIGQKDYGKIEFLEPVDLSNISLPALCGQIVVFEPRACSVYPNASVVPAHGEGLNVRARISNYGCYPLDKSTRDPIKDPNHPIIKRHVNKLKAISCTKFDSYNPQTGTWVFTVESPVGN